MEEFWSLPHARALIEAWRIEYNSELRGTFTPIYAAVR